MLKLIRNIPKKLNWRYAIGEFLIVVIGIVVALQVDSWKEKSNNQKLQLEYLEDIKNGLQADSSFYTTAVNYFNTIKINIDSSLTYTLKKSNRIPITAQNGIREITNWYRIYISNTVFEELNNSGRLNLITDKSLRYNLIAYYQYIDFIKVLDNEYNQSLTRMSERLLEKIDFSSNTVLTLSNKDHLIITNYLLKKKTYLSNYLQHRKICQNINQSMQKRIDEIIKKLK